MVKKWAGILTLQSPLSHNGDEIMGNEAKFRRQRILVDGKPLDVPIYSGNAMRGRLRRMAAADMVALLGGGQVDPSVYHTIFAGGALDKGADTGLINITKQREARLAIPMLSLFGAAMGNQMLAGKLRIGLAVPITQETRVMTGMDAETSIWDIMDDSFYTRRDDLEDRPEDIDSHQMIYKGEVMAAGTRLHHTVALVGANEVEESCLGRIMRLFEADPVLGGQSGRGHGRVLPEYAPEWPAEALYLEHIQAYGEAMRQALGLHEQAA